MILRPFEAVEGCETSETTVKGKMIISEIRNLVKILGSTRFGAESY